jgi:hypothetical protein
LRELSELVPNDVWLHNLEINDNGAQLTGEGPAAAPLLALLDGSSRLTGASFASSLVKTGATERFQINVKRRAVEEPPRSQAVVQPAASAPRASVAARPSEQGQTLSTVSGEEPAANGESN